MPYLIHGLRGACNVRFVLRLTDGKVDCLVSRRYLSETKQYIAANSLVSDRPASALHPRTSVLQRRRPHISQSSAPLLFATSLLVLAHGFEMLVTLPFTDTVQ
jgi:hypothetical protein